jgi:hypothetical protein
MNIKKLYDESRKVDKPTDEVEEARQTRDAVSEQANYTSWYLHSETGKFLERCEKLLSDYNNDLIDLAFSCEDARVARKAAQIKELKEVIKYARRNTSPN